MTFSIGGLSSVLDGKYRLDDRLGEGTAGIVYRATHLGLKKVSPVLAVLLGGLPLYLGLSIPIFHRAGLLWPVTPLLPALIALAFSGILRQTLSPIPRSEDP